MESGVPLQLAANQPHPTGAEEMSSHRAPGPGPTAGMAPSGSALPPFNDPMRAYRACLHCRSRKTKCNLDANGGRPPCRRCHREGRECVLGESHRGGRRVRKKPKIDPDSSIGDIEIHAPSPSASLIRSNTEVSEYPPPPATNDASPYQGNYVGAYNPPMPWPGLAPTSAAPEPLSFDETSQHLMPKATRKQEDVTAAELHNPSDALGILARVADSQENGASNNGSPRTAGIPRDRLKSWVEPAEPIGERTLDFAYPPVVDGKIAPQVVYQLFDFFEKNYHAYFPVVSKEVFHRPRIPWMSKAQPHLFSAIMTVASKDDLLLHQICYTHMQGLVSDIVSGADADIEAVEALLILSQWMCQRPQPRGASQVGRGEEDRVAWMYIGTALRLGWYLGIDRASFNDATDQSAKFSHKRLVWTACYMADRNVSVRLGKGFWARGPGPLPDKSMEEFPTLEPSPHEHGQDHLGRIFKAQLGLTQLFSNVHDILYSSRGNGWKEMLEGRYAKYLDDFRMSIRNWQSQWGKLECSDRLKASLLLSYDYLRLYVNAFAYQATISRAMVQSKSRSEPIPLLDASTPDARFIYEAIDAARSLISKVNTFITPEALRYMPCRYYMYIAYSAVFLYKARSTTMMSQEERSEIRSMISTTIDRLRQSSIGANQMGTRYSKLLDLLWKKAPPKPPSNPAPTYRQHQQPQAHYTHTQHQNPNIDHRLLNDPSNLTSKPQQPRHLNSPTAGTNPLLSTPPMPYDPSLNYPPMTTANAFMIPDHTIPDATNINNTFSWLDLPGAYGFATQNLGNSGEEAELSSANGSLSGGGGGGGWGGGMNLGVVGDFRGLEENVEGLIF